MSNGENCWETFVNQFLIISKKNCYRLLVHNTINSIGKYRQVAIVRLVGILLMVFIKKDLFSSLSNIFVDTVGTGLMGKLVSENFLVYFCEILKKSL